MLTLSDPVDSLPLASPPRTVHPLGSRARVLLLIQANIEAPSMVLDFPTLDRFIEEICSNHYDVVGISSIIPNLLKVKKRYKNHPDPRIRRRFTWEGRDLGTMFSAVIWAVKRYYRRENPAMRAKMAEILSDLYREFGWKSRLAAALAGPGS